MSKDLKYKFKTEFAVDCYKMEMFHISFSMQLTSLVLRQIYFQFVVHRSIICMNFCF